MEIPVCSFIVHITSFKFLAIFLVAALSVSPGFSWFGYRLFPFFLGYGSQFPISSHSSWSLLGPGHHECYVVEFLDPAVFPLLVFNLAGLEPCPSCKYTFFSSRTLLLVCPSLSCWFFSKTPGVFPTQVWLSSSKIWVDSRQIWGLAPSVALYLPGFPLTYWTLFSDASRPPDCCFLPPKHSWSVPLAKLQNHQSDWQKSFKGGLAGSVCLLWSPPVSSNRCVSLNNGPEFFLRIQETGSASMQCTTSSMGKGGFHALCRQAYCVSMYWGSQADLHGVCESVCLILTWRDVSTESRMVSPQRWLHFPE